MAKLFPDSSKARVVFASKAEEQFYNLCREKLGKSWRVYYSCVLSSIENSEGLKDNEIDFVLYHPRYGVVVIEVKGGRIRYDVDSSTFYSVNRMEESFIIKNPFQQALVWKSRFLRFLKQSAIKLPVSHAVCFPNVVEEDFPKQPGVEPEIIIGKNRLLDLEKSLKDVVNVSQPEKYLKFVDVATKIDKILAGTNFCTKFYFRDYIEGHELRVQDIENINESLVTPVANSMRLGIEGEAGTGKTMLALQLSKYFRDQSKSVLLLSSNDLLNLYLKQEAGSQVTVKTYEELAASYGVNILNPSNNFKGSTDDWIQFEAPIRLMKAVEKSEQRFDVILCDEAQDVQPFWWDVIEKLLKAGKESRFYIFFDRSQGVFGSGGGDRHFIPEEVIPIKPPYFPLVNNYRTTREIATFARHFRTGKQILQSHSSRLGYVPQIVVYENATDFKTKLQQLLNQLTVGEALNANDITLLSARKPNADQSMLNGVSKIGNLELHPLAKTAKNNWQDAASPVQKVPISTVAAFKGLETKIGVLVNVSEYNLPVTHPLMASLIYVACTRAKHMLYIFLQKNDNKVAHFEKALREIKTSGSLVLGNDMSEAEFVGKVVHYNPERIGWLSVEDPNFQKNNVMFFPTDVAKSKIAAIKVGDKVVFRPKVEGLATVACDLKLVDGF